MKEPTFHHRSTLKQKNKPFKSRFATKSSQRDKAKGRTQRASVKGKVPRKHSRLDRRNAVRTEQRKKREQLAMATRIFSGRHRAPKIVAVVPLCADSDTRALVRALFAAGDAPYAAGALLDVPRFKQTLRFVEVGRHALDILDAAKAADYVVVALSAHTEVDAFGEHCLRAMQNQGHAGVFPVVQGLDHVAAKRRMDVRRSLQSFVAHFCPDAEKVHAVDAPVEGLAVLRMLTAQAPRAVRWRDTRPYMLADHVDFAPSADNADRGLLAITGYLRGANLSANRLVHVPSFGDFQIEQITAEPLAMEPARGSAIDADDSAGVVLDRPDPAQQDSLVAANEPDAMQNEQTWPEDHEMAGWDAQMAQMDADEQRVVRVPRGTSAYQAAWIAEGSDASDDDSSMDSGSSADGYSDDEDPDADEYEDLRVAPASAAASEHGSDDDGNLLSADEEAA
ncbi:ribosome biogenesis protein tsr1, partial [Coemansia sp. RSA 2706]